MCSLIEGGWILISASAFNLLEYVGLVEVYEETLVSHRSVVRKGRIFFTQLFHILWIFFFDTSAKRNK